MTITRTRADRYAIVGFTLGVLSALALLAAYSFVILRWPPGIDGPGAILYVATFPVSLVGSLLSGWGRFSPTRRRLAWAGMVLSLGAAILIVGVWILAIIAVSLTPSSPF
jgi:hypothetical protein